MRFSEHGISPDPLKVDTIKEVKAPTTPEELKSFLGLASYVQTFVTNFSTVTAPLWELIKIRNSIK